MTTVSFQLEGERIVGFRVAGHADYAQAGADIVCAAVSSAVNLVEATVNQVLGLAASFKVRDALVSFHLPGGLSVTDEATCQNLLVGLMVYFSDLHQQYPSFVEVEADDPAENEDAQ